MGYQVVFAPQALRSLEQIVSFIAREDPSVALRFGLRLIDHAELLAIFPKLGVTYPKRAGVRRLACRPYFIYYRVQRRKRIVEIMEFWHAAQREPEF